MRILLVTNYKEDEQKSMLRFGNLLASDFSNKGIEVSEVFPKSNIQKFCSGTKIRKWAGYLDKYFLFQKRLDTLLKDKSFDIIHIIDHSNSIYLPKLSRLTKTPKVTTCHDMIAIRAAYGEFPMAPITSRTGKYLQKWIASSLEISDFYVCDSKQSQNDLLNRIPSSGGNSKIIHLGVNQAKVDNSYNLRTPEIDLKDTKYLLHVGNDAWYKNRKGVLKAFKFVQDHDNCIIDKLVLVGPEIQKHELNPELENWKKKNKNKLISLTNVSENLLQALYQQATLLVFPSFIEGFGWPPLEAHANNCFSITTKTGAIFEVLKDNAIYVDPNNQNELNNAVLMNLLNNKRREFTKSLPTNNECTKNYTLLYKDIISNHHRNKIS